MDFILPTFTGPDIASTQLVWSSILNHPPIARYQNQLLQDDAALLASVLAKRISDQLPDQYQTGCRHLSDFPLKPTVQLGSASGNYIYNVSGGFSCYDSSEYESGALNTVLVGRSSPLLPGSQYFYRTGDPEYGWSREFSFKTAPPVSSRSVPYRWSQICGSRIITQSCSTNHCNWLTLCIFVR